MLFFYHKITDAWGDEDERDYDGYTVEYDADDDEIKEELTKIFAEEDWLLKDGLPYSVRRGIAKHVIEIVDDAGALEELAFQYEDELKDAFEDRAFEAYAHEKY